MHETDNSRNQIRPVMTKDRFGKGVGVGDVTEVWQMININKFIIYLSLEI